MSEGIRAWQVPEYGDPWSILTEGQAAIGPVEPGCLQVAVEATDLNFADILQCQGKYQVRLAPPFTPGMNTAGVITGIGAGVTGFALGQRVVGPTHAEFGGYADEAVIHSSQAHPIADGVTSHTAAAMHVTYGTAWFGLHHRGQLQPGETLLVLAAAGGVGAAALDLAKQQGCWVIAAAGGSAKLEQCRKLGADEVIDYNAEDLYTRVMDLTQGHGVNVVYDPVGGRYFDIARRLVAWEGRLLVIGFASGDIPAAPLNHALVKNYSLVGVHMGGYRGRDEGPFKQCYAELDELILAGKISPLIDEVVGFAQLPKALLRLNQRQTTGRVIFDPRQ